MFEKMSDKLDPAMILTIYSDGYTCYIETRTVSKKGLGAAKPLNIKTLKDIVSLFNADDLKTEISYPYFKDGIVPDNLILADIKNPINVKYIWFEPSKKRNVLYQIPQSKKVIMKTPAILYIQSEDKLQVYALNSDVKPKMSTELYNYPFPNITSGAVCLGNVKKVDTTGMSINEILGVWQMYFWKSIFTGDVTKKYTLTKVGIKLSNLLK